MYSQLGNLVHQYQSEFLIYAPGRCGSTSISKNPEFEPLEHIRRYEPDDSQPRLMYIITREPKARLISALYQMYSKLYETPGDWQNRITQINEYMDHNPVGRIHYWGLPQHIPGTDRVHCENYITDLKALCSTWPIQTVWVDLSELDYLMQKNQISTVGRNGVPINKQSDYSEFRTALTNSDGWPAWQSYIIPEQSAWQSVVGRAF